MIEYPETLLQSLTFWKKKKKKSYSDDEASNIRFAARQELDAKSHDMERALAKLQPITGLLTPEESSK